jgi:hypothetical protein
LKGLGFAVALPITAITCDHGDHPILHPVPSNLSPVILVLCFLRAIPS